VATPAIEPRPAPAASFSDLPPGFQVETPVAPAATFSDLPPGFQIEAPMQPGAAPPAPPNGLQRLANESNQLRLIDPAAAVKMATDNGRALAQLVMSRDQMTTFAPPVPPPPIAPLLQPTEQQNPSLINALAGPTTVFGRQSEPRLRQTLTGKSPDERRAAARPSPMLVDPSELRLENLIPGEGMASKSARGAMKGLESAAGGLMTPESITIIGATMGAAAIPVVRRLVSAGFSYDMLKTAWQQNPQLKRQIAEGDVEGAAATAMSMGVNVAMGVGAGLHAGDVHPTKAGKARAAEAKQATAAEKEARAAAPQPVKEYGGSAIGLNAPRVAGFKPRAAPAPEYTITGRRVGGEPAKPKAAQPVETPAQPVAAPVTETKTEPVAPPAKPVVPPAAKGEPPAPAPKAVETKAAPAVTPEPEPPKPEPKKEPTVETKVTPAVAAPARETPAAEPVSKPESAREPERGGGTSAPAVAPAGETEVTPAPEPKKPVGTPQVPNEPDTKYVLPTFATGGVRGAAKAERPNVTRARAIRDKVKAGTPYKQAVAEVDAPPVQPVETPVQPAAADVTAAPEPKPERQSKGGEPHGTDTVSGADTGALEPGAAGSSEATGKPGSAPAGAEVHGGPGEPRLQPVHRPGAEPGSGGRTDEGNLDGSVTRVTRPPRPLRTLDDRPRLTGYRITGADHLGEGSLSDKAIANLEAIRTMKQVEAEGRPATLDEQKKLVKYTGWGALPEVFEHYQTTAALRQAAGELRDMLTPEEWKTAAATTPNAHYTSEQVVRAIWDAVRHLGGRPGLSALEPSMGSGNFFGLMPDDLQSGAKLSGVELDPVTARIAALLYPNAAVFPMGFERTRFPNNWFDLAVSNVPFGNYGVFDRDFKGPRRFLTGSIHDFFFGKALDKVRPGGIVAFVTSRYTMDGKDPAVREYIQREAKFLGAIRLPQTAFEKNAGTTVVTDIVFLQKRLPGDASEAEDFVKASPTNLFPGDENNPYQNDYYTRHPEMILGTVKGNRGRFGPEINVLGQVTPEALAGAIARLPANVLTERPAADAFKPAAIAAAEYPEAGHLKQNAFGIVDGKLIRRSGETLEPVEAGRESAARVKGMIPVRDAMHEVFRTQLEDKPEAEQVAARKALGKVYDSFAKKYGNLNDDANVRAFRGDPDAPSLLALEKYDRKTKTAKKTAIFTEPVVQAYKPVQSAGNALEALTISLNEYGRLNWTRMAQLTGLDPEALQDELGERIYRDPETQQWQTADHYLSGDVRQKLAQARDMAKADPSYERNIAALEAVKPPDLKGGTEIKGRLGSPWIPAPVVKQFITELLGVQPRGVNVAYAKPLALWEVQIDNTQTVQNQSQWAGGGMPADKLIEQALNMKVPTVRVRVSEDKTVVDPRATAAAQEAQKKIRDRFSQWLWENPARRDALEKYYNETYNGTRLRQYDGSHLTFRGMNPSVTLRPHQENAIWRVVSSGLNTLLAHVVGAGKTYEMAAAAMELRRLGLAKKPLITVPANVVGQFGREFQHLYPAANLFVADETTFQKGNRQKAMAQIATGNYDAAIVSHDALGLIPVSDETFNMFLQKEIDQLEEALREMAATSGKADKRVRKELEKSKKRLEAKLREKADTRKDDALTWEQMGVDALFVDEADLFKNLYFTTRATRIAGIPNSESNRAFDMLMKSRHVTDKANGRLVFATGTPISNTVAEMYTMLRYLAPKALDEAGVSMFDAWAQVFGETVTGQEISPDGAGFRTNTRFAKFTNLPELQNLFRAVADVQTADMLKLPVPKLAEGKYETVTIPATQALRDFIMAKDERGVYQPDSIMGRIQRIKRGNVNPKADNMLKVTSDGRKAALDLRLVGMARDPEGGKVTLAANRIFELWEQGKEKRTTQLVFSDLSTPGEGWNVYDELRRQLTLKGVPAEEIAFVHDADTNAKKAVWQQKMNDGEIRITIGSTAKMGAGTNVQKRLIALHHLDVPWRPRDVEQREGRILRQGNMNPEVHIVRYVTAPSFDAYMWGMVARKAKFINQVMRGDLGLREAEDISQDALGASEAEAAATGNPLVKEKATVDAEVFRLSALESDYAIKQDDARREAMRMEREIARAKEWRPKLEADIRTRDGNTPKDPDDWSITVNGKKYTERKAAGEALNEFAIGNRLDDSTHKAGTYRGFTIETRGMGASMPPRTSFRGDALHYFNLNPESGQGTMQSLDAQMRGLDGLAGDYRQEIEKGEEKLARLRVEAATPFPDGATLDGLVKRQAEIAKALDLDANAAVIDEAEADTPEPDAAGASQDPNAPALETPPPKNPEAGGALLDFLTLGLTQFAQTDVAPALRDVAQGMRETGRDALKVLAPTLFDRDAEDASLVLRGKLAELARKADRARDTLAKASAYFAKQPAAENLDFIDRMELGQRQKNADLDAIAFRLRTLLDDKRADVQSLGTGKLQTFYKDYFPHIWKNPRRAKTMFQAFFGKRPLEGGKAFLKKRSLPTIADGLAVGLEPLSDNPVTMTLLKVHEMDRYVMAHETLAEWKQRGLAKFFRGNRPPPNGWKRIDDSISTVYGRNAAGETIVRGHYYAPEGAARIMNNYLSPGLRQYAGYRAIAGLNNVLNQFQLGLSAFHLGFTAADTTVSKAALGYQALMRGRPIKAAKYFAQTPAAAFTTYLKGDKLLREWYRPGSQGAVIGNLVDNLVTAGGRARMDQMYRTEIAEKMREALRHGNIIGAALRAPFAGVEYLSNLLMNEAVPRMKLGAFADLARFHLDELGPNATFDEARRVLTQDWNSVENRLGEMTYDNLFWNKMAKDLAMIAVRSVGWNLGTLREVGGAIGDIGLQPYNALKGKPVNLNRLSYLLGLVTVNAVMSAVYQYLKTGKGPDEIEDYFFPKNGETDEAGHPQRVSWPTYVKDVYHYATQPARTIANKAAPIWSALAEMAHNKDFYGNQIRNPDDPLVTQLLDLAKHAAKQAIPIGVRNYQRETALGGSLSTRGEQFVGVSPAPSELDKTPAERLAAKLSAERMGDEPGRPAEAAERRDLRQSLVRALRNNKPVPKEVIDALKAGKLRTADVKAARQRAHESPLEAAFARLTIGDALKVYRASTADERRRLRGMLLEKGTAALKSEAPAERLKTVQGLREALAGR
jgi:N12 class adenine-specific DNA methylase